MEDLTHQTDIYSSRGDVRLLHRPSAVRGQHPGRCLRILNSMPARPHPAARLSPLLDQM